MKRLAPLLLVVALLALSLGLCAPRRESPGRPSPTVAHVGSARAEGAQPDRAGRLGPGEIDPSAQVFFNPGGLYYHAVEHCSGMQGAHAATVAEAIAAGKNYCPVCQPATPISGDWFMAAFGQDLSGLYPGYSYRRTLQNEADFDVWRISDGWREVPVCLVERGRLCLDPTPTPWESGSVRLTLDLGDISDVEGFLSRAPDPVRAMAQADLDSLAGPQGLPTDGTLALGRMERLQAVFDREGTLVSLAMQFPGRTATYRAEWTRQDDSFLLYLSVRTTSYFMRGSEPLARVDA